MYTNQIIHMVTKYVKILFVKKVPLLLKLQNIIITGCVHLCFYEEH